MYRADFRIRDNADFVFALALTDQFTDAPFEIPDGATFEMDIRTSRDAAEESATLTSGNGRIAVNEDEAGQIEVTFPAGLLEPGNYVHDLNMVVDGEKTPVFEGSVTVIEGVTR